MNERFLKLAQQTDVWCDQNYYGDEQYDLRWEEKFAELIVRECATVVSNVPPGYKDYRDQIEEAMRDDCVAALLKHFGVEE